MMGPGNKQLDDIATTTLDRAGQTPIPIPEEAASLNGQRHVRRPTMMGPGNKRDNGTLNRAGQAPPLSIPEEEAARTYGSEEMDPSYQMQPLDSHHGLLFPPLKMGHDREERKTNEESGNLKGSKITASKSAAQLHILDENEPRLKVSPTGSNSASLFGSKSMHVLNHVERWSEDSGLLPPDGSSRFSAVPAVFRMKMALKDPAPVFRSKTPSQDSQWMKSKVTSSLLRPPIPMNRQDERSEVNITSEIKTKLRVSNQEERRLLIRGEMEVQNRIWSEKERSQLRQNVNRKKKAAKLERHPSKEKNNIPLFGA
jgi:hypothetical protein